MPESGELGVAPSARDGPGERGSRPSFYPLSVYPGWLQVVVTCSPLYQGVALMRELDAGALGLPILVHVAYLAAMGLAGLRLATARLGKLLLP